MNKKIFKGALIAALGALLSVSASAAITYTSSVATSDKQGGNAVAAPGGGSVRANDLTLFMAGAELSPGASNTPTVAVRLPDGINFDGNPKFTVTPATSGSGLTLKDASGDPTLDNPGITLSDTNGDGGMDRALVNVASASAANDTLTISVNITVGASVAKSTTAKQANIIVGTTINPVDLVVVNDKFVEPIYSSAAGFSRSQLDTANVSPTQTFILTIPKGAKGTSTMTLTVDSGVFLSPAAASSTLTVTQLTPSGVGGVLTSGSYSQTANSSATTSFTLTVTGTSTYTMPDDVQIQVALNNLGKKSSTTILGGQGLKVAGLVTGQLVMLDVKKSGSAATLTTGQKVKEIVVGSSAEQTLPSFTIKENFVGDFGVGGSLTITVTPSAGLKFGLTDTITYAAGSNSVVSAGVATATISTTGIMTLSVSNTLTVGSLTLTVSGIKATASAAGTHTLTIGKPGKDNTTAPNADVVAVASGVAVGTVSGKLATASAAKTTGAGQSGNSTIELQETTYGAVTRKEASTTTNAYIRISSPDGILSSASIAAVTSGAKAYPSSAQPTFGTCAKETPTSTNSWVCTVNTESSGVTAGTSTINVSVGWASKSTAAVGSSVTVKLDGNAGVSGEFVVTNIGQATKTTVGVIKDIAPGSLTAASLAPVTITGQFANAVTDTVGATIRLLAPAGLAFQDAASVQSSASIGTATITSTFRPNDTLSMQIATTTTITFTAKAIASSDAAKGLASFELVDGDINGKNLSGITAATVDLAYVDGTLKALSAGKAAAVNVGFSVSNTVEGGLAPYTVASSAKTIATAEISGSTVTAKGVAAGAATITVTDALGATSTYVVTVSAGASEPTAGKATKASDGSTSAATFTGGATTDGGTSYTTAITTADDVIINATITVDPADVGKKGGIHAVVLSPAGFLMLESDGSWVPWNGKISSIATYLEADALAATYSVPLYNGTIATAGKWRFAVIYSTADGKLVYTTKAAVITVSE
jgi:hypothetical protein